MISYVARHVCQPKFVFVICICWSAWNMIILEMCQTYVFHSFENAVNKNVEANWKWSLYIIQVHTTAHEIEREKKMYFSQQQVGLRLTNMKSESLAEFCCHNDNMVCYDFSTIEKKLHPNSTDGLIKINLWKKVIYTHIRICVNCVLSEKNTYSQSIQNYEYAVCFLWFSTREREKRVQKCQSSSSWIAMPFVEFVSIQIVREQIFLWCPLCLTIKCPIKIQVPHQDFLA